MKHQLAKALAAAFVATTLVACGSGDSESTEQHSSTESEVSLPDREFSSERPLTDAPKSVVEQGLFQTLPSETQAQIRQLEGMSLDAFKSQDPALQRAYGQFILNAAAPYVFNFYETNTGKFGYPALSDEVKDAYLNGVPKDADPQVLETRLNLIKLAVTTMYEEYNGQDLQDSTRYTQGQDKGYVYNVLESRKLLHSAYLSDGNTGADAFLTSKITATEPQAITDYCYVTESSAVFESKNFSIFQTGTAASTQNLVLEVIHCNTDKPNGPALQNIHQFEPLTISFLPARSPDRFVNLLARGETSTSTSYYDDLEQFAGPGYGY